MAIRVGVFAGDSDVGDLPTDLAAVDALVGGGFQYSMSYYDLHAAVPTADLNAAIALGMTPIVTVSITDSSGNVYPLADVISGVHDSYIIAFAQGLAAYAPQTIYYRLEGEMNLKFAPSTTPYFGTGTVAQYIAMWQHITTLVRANASNVEMIWCPNNNAPNNLAQTVYSPAGWTGILTRNQADGVVTDPSSSDGTAFKASLAHATDPTWSVTTETTIKVSGFGSSKVVTPNLHTNEGIIANSDSVSPSTAYTAQVKVRGSGTVQLFAAQYDSSHVPIGTPSLSSTVTLASGSWQTLTVTFTTASNCALLRIGVQTTSQQAATFYCDEWQVDVGSSALAIVSPFINRFYPGDSYVDLVGVDGYNGWGGLWSSFDSIFGPIAAEFAQFMPSKQVLICETSAYSTGTPLAHDKSEFIYDAQSRLLSGAYPSWIGLVWFHQNKEHDWRFTETPASILAMQRLVGMPMFTIDDTVVTFMGGLPTIEAQSNSSTVLHPIGRTKAVMSYPGTSETTLTGTVYSSVASKSEVASAVAVGPHTFYDLDGNFWDVFISDSKLTPRPNSFSTWDITMTILGTH